MKNIIQFIGLISLVFTVNAAIAKSPHIPPEPINLMNVVTVSAENGDFTSPVEAINSILDASDSNPYLVQIGPGVYELGTEQIIMKEWVTIQGSGQDATKITGLVSSGSEGASSAIVVGSNNAAITNLTVENTGGSVSTAIYNNSVSPRIEHVTALASGTNNAYAIHNSTGASPILSNVIAIGEGAFSAGVLNYENCSPIMTNVIATGLGQTYSYGVFIQYNSSPTMTNVTASGSGGTTNNYGVYINEWSNPAMTNVTATGSGGANNYGIYIYDASHPTIMNSTAIGSDGTNNYGLRSMFNSYPFVQTSILEGSTYGLHISADSTNTRVVNSTIVGGVDDLASDTIQCRGNYDENLIDEGC